MSIITTNSNLSNSYQRQAFCTRIKTKLPYHNAPTSPVESYPLGITVIKWRSCGLVDDYKPPEAMVQELTEEVQLILIDQG